MSDNSLQKSIYENFSQKETDALIQIWQENKRHEWSDLAFEVIQKILQERQIDIPPQNAPQIETETEQEREGNEFEEQLSSDDQPIFYKPQQLMFFADAASITAWITLAIYIIIGFWNFFSNWSIYSATPVLVGGMITLFSRILVGLINFFLLKGISLALYVLMEFEFNSRHVK